MKNVYKLIMISITALLISCDTDPILAPSNQVSLVPSKDIVINVAEVTVGETISEEIKIYTGGAIDEDRVYDLSITDITLPDANISIPASASITVPAGSNEGVLDFSLNYNSEFPITGGSFVVNLENTDANDLAMNTQTSVVISVTCDTPATVEFLFDGYANETDWTIADSDGNVLYSGGGYAEGQESFIRQVCLNDGTYTFTVNDSFGDGLSFPNEGTASIIFDGEVLVQGVGNFGSSFEGEFTIQN